MGPSPRPATEIGTGEPEPPDTKAVEVWQEALSQLQHQMPTAIFASQLHGSYLVEVSDGAWKVGVQPHAVGWLTNRPNPLIARIVAYLVGSEISLEYVADERPPTPALKSAPRAKAPRAASAPSREPSRRARKCSPPSALERLLFFDPNSASGGGFWKMGHYANWFWAAFLGTVVWRVYELVVSGDKRSRKTLWTPPRRVSVSELARAIASPTGRRSGAVTAGSTVSGSGGPAPLTS